MEILIVDDTIENIKLVSDLLGDFDTSFARSGEEALKLLAGETFDLILLDVMMPGLDGFETCQQLRQIPSSSEIPVIFLTAKNDDESIVKGFQSGGQDFITKPFNTEELRARVKNQLLSKRYQDRLKQQLAVEREKNQAQKQNLEQDAEMTQMKESFSKLQKSWEKTSKKLQDTAKEPDPINDIITDFNLDMQEAKKYF